MEWGTSRASWEEDSLANCNYRLPLFLFSSSWSFIIVTEDGHYRSTQGWGGASQLQWEQSCTGGMAFMVVQSFRCFLSSFSPFPSLPFPSLSLFLINHKRIFCCNWEHVEGIFFCLFSETVKITSREPISQGFLRTLSFALPHHQPLLFFSFTLDTTMGESCILTQKERVCVCVCVCVCVYVCLNTSWPLRNSSVTSATRRQGRNWSDPWSIDPTAY